MKCRILPTKDFEKDFAKLDAHFQSRIKKKIDEIAENPTRYKHLHFNFVGSSRIRIGKLRIIFSYSSEKMELYLEKIVFGHKYS